MATTSYIYHSFDLRNHRLIRTEYKGGKNIFHVERKPSKRKCSNCRALGKHLVMDGRFIRTYHALPIGNKIQLVVLHGHRYKCSKCRVTRREPSLSSPSKRRYLPTFARYVFALCSYMTIKHVAQKLKVSWDMIKEIHREYLSKRRQKVRISKLRLIGVDEFAIRKGHNYMTVVMDLKTGMIVYAHEGKGSDALIPFLLRLRKARSKIKAIAIDMSAAYTKAVNVVFGKKVPLVYDRYHVTALMNKAIDEMRRRVQRELEEKDCKTMKGYRFVLLKGREKLDEVGKKRLEELKSINNALYEAYLLKEDLRQLWTMPDRIAAEDHFCTWLGDILGTMSEELYKVAKTFTDHLEGILAYFDCRVTTAKLEGMNNKIKVLKRNAYGYRDMEYFKLRLMFLYESRFELIG